MGDYLLGRDDAIEGITGAEGRFGFEQTAGHGQDSRVFVDLVHLLTELVGADKVSLAYTKFDPSDFTSVRAYLLTAAGLDCSATFLSGEAWAAALVHLDGFKTNGAGTSSDGGKFLAQFCRPFADKSVARLAALVPGHFGLFSVEVTRALSAGPFTGNERTVLQSWLPQLQGIGLLKHLMAQDKTERTSFADALKCLTQPAFIVTPERDIRGSNAAGRAMLERKIRIHARDGKLHALAVEDNRKLADALSSLASRDLMGDSLCLKLHDDIGSAACAVLSLVAPQLVLVAVEDVESVPKLNPKIAALYGLTAAEVALAETLLAGEMPDSFAAARNVKITTVRSQLSSLLRKTETERQSQLVARLTRLNHLKW